MAYIYDYCKDCEHARFCKTWGEFKCVKHAKNLPSGDTIACSDFKKRKGDVVECKCDDCHNRGDLED